MLLKPQRAILEGYEIFSLRLGKSLHKTKKAIEVPKGIKKDTEEEEMLSPKLGETLAFSVVQ